MALDPNAPWGWIPQEWAAPIGDAFLPSDQVPPSSLIPPDPQMPQERAPDPIPYDEEEAKYHGGGGAPRWEQGKGWEGFPGAGGAMPWDPPAARPRDDSARIGTFGAPGGDEIRRGAIELPSEDAAQIEIDPLSAKSPHFDIEMPEEFAGRPEPMPIDPYDDPVGHIDVEDAGPQPVNQYANDAAPVDGRMPGMPDEYRSAAELGEKRASESEEDFIRRQLEDKEARENLEHAERLTASRQLREQADLDQRADTMARERATKRSAELDAEAQKLAETPIDNEAWMNSRAPLQKVAAFAAAILGGLASGSTGGRNMGLEAIQRTIDQHIETQKANHANKRASIASRQNSVDNQYARDMDGSRAAEAQRLAMYDMAIRDIKEKVAGYDPRGRTAIEAEGAIRGLYGARQKAKADADRQAFTDELTLAKHGLEESKHLLEVDKFRLQQKKALLAGAGGVKRPPEYFAQLKLPVPPFAMTDKEHAAWMAHQKTAKELNGGDAKSRKESADAAKAEAESQAATTGYQIKNPETGEVITNPDGTPVVEMDPTKRNRASSIIEAAANVRRLADRMAALKKNHGGSIKALGSDEAQEMQQLVSQIDFETFKAFDLGAPSAGDRDLAEGVRGGADPTSFVKDATAGFQAYADAVEKKANTALRNSGYKGTALRFHRAADLKKAERSFVDDFATDLAKAQYVPYDAVNDPVQRPYVVPPLPQVQKANKLVDEKFAGLAAHADQQTPDGDLARKALKRLADKAVSPAVRAKAKALLDGLPGTNQRESVNR